MQLQKLLQDTCDAGDALLQYAKNRVAQEVYCARLELYRQHLQQQREKAMLQLQQFRAYNDKIFQQAMQVLDMAIAYENVEMARAALKTIETMKATYPDFYRSYHRLLLGGTGGNA